MEKIAQALNVLAPILYVLTVIDYFVFFFREGTFAKKTIGPLLKATLLMHVFYLFSFTFANRHFPLASVFEVMTTLSFAIALVYFYVEQTTHIKTTGPFILLLAFLFQFISSSFIILTPEINPLLSNYVPIFHTGSVILGYSGFAVAFVYGLLYLMLYHQIKSRHLGLIYSRLPALEKLYDMCKVSIYFGFVFLTLGLALGIFWSSRIFPDRWPTDPKFAVGVLTWFIYGLCIISLKLGWESKKGIYFSLVGFCVSLFSLLAMNIFVSSFHDFM